MGDPKLARSMKMSLSDAPARPIGSVGTALHVLLMLRDSTSVRVADVARDLNMAPSSAHRVLGLLQQFDFVRQDEMNKSYMRGPALMEVGLAAVEHLPVRQAGYRAIRTLRDVVGETVELCVRDDRDSVVVDVAEGLLPLRVVDELGDRMPSHLTAAGKAILACLGQSEIDALFPSEELETVTGASIHNRAQLTRELAKIRKFGYATNLGETGPEFVGVAAAVVDGRGDVHGAVTVALPWARATEGFEEHLGPQVRRTAETIGAVL